MKFIAYGAVLLVVATTIVGCGGVTPTSPSQVTDGFSPMTVNRTLGDAGDVGIIMARLLAGTDGEYASADANSNFTLIQWGTVAEQRGDRAEVKSFARQLRAAYTRRCVASASRGHEKMKERG